MDIAETKNGKGLSLNPKIHKITYLNSVLMTINKTYEVFSREDDTAIFGISICETFDKSGLYSGVSLALLNKKHNRIEPIANTHLFKMRWTVSADNSIGGPSCIKEILQDKKNKIHIWQGSKCKKCNFCRQKNLQQIILFTLIYNDKIIGIFMIFVEKEKTIYEEEISLLEKMNDNYSAFFVKLESEDSLKSRVKEYKTFVENLNEGIWVIDKVYNTTFVNTKLASMLKYEKEELIGKPILKFVNLKDKRNFWIYLKQCIMGIKKQYDCRLNCKSGQQIFSLITASPVINEKGIYNGLLLGIVNISRRKQIERSLIKKNKILNRFNNIAVQRELRMIELKKEINSLLSKLEKELKYRV